MDSSEEPRILPHSAGHFSTTSTPRDHPQRTLEFLVSSSWVRLALPRIRLGSRGSFNAKGSSGAAPVMSLSSRAVGIALAAFSPRRDTTPVAGWRSGS